MCRGTHGSLALTFLFCMPWAHEPVVFLALWYMGEYQLPPQNSYISLPKLRSFVST